MAIIQFTGFETGDFKDLFQAVTGSPTIITSPVYSGTYAMEAAAAGANTSVLVKAPDATGVQNDGSGLAAFGVTFAFRYTAVPAATATIIRLNTTTTAIFEIKLTTLGSLNIVNQGTNIGSTSAQMAVDTWHIVSLRGSISATTGTIGGSLNGTEFASGTGLNTGAVNINRLRFGCITATTLTAQFDDVIWGDTDAYPTAGRVYNLKPIGTGNTDTWSGTFADVDDIPTSTADYREADLTDTSFSQTLQSSSTVGFGGSVKAVKSWADWAATGGVTLATALRLRSGSTNDDTSAASSTAEQFRAKIYETDPNTSSAWTMGAIDAIQVGMDQTTADALNTGRAYAVGAMVLVDGIDKSDTVTVSESVGRMLQSHVSKSDSVTVSESTNLTLVHNIAVSDTVTITEDVARLETNFVNVLDNIAITESSAVSIESIGDLTLSVSDSITISESLQRMLQSFVSVSDSITITESVNRLLVSFVTVSDSVTITESSLVLLTARVSVSDAITITESVSLLIPVLFITASDSITLSESVSLFRTPLFVSVSDSLTITENVSVSIPATGGNVSTSDTITVSEEMSRYTDLIAVREEVTVQIVAGIPERNINVSDTITITESIGKLITELFIRILDTRLKDEAGNFILDESGNYIYDEGPIDLITVSESIGRTQIHNITKSDTITITESIGRLQTSFISKSDTITVTENVSLFSATLGPVVSDTITVSESLAISRPENPTYTITVNLSNNVVTINDLANTITVTVPESIIRADLSPGTTTVRIL